MKAPLPPNEAQRLETLRGYDVLDTLPEQAFDDLTLLAAQICQVPIAVVSLVDENRQWFKSIIGLDAKETPRDVAFCAHSILNPEELLEVRDAQLDPRFADNPLVTAAPYIRFYAGAPLVAPDGVALGTLCVIDCVPRELSTEQKTALRALSRTVIAQLELRTAHRRAKEQVEERTADLQREIEMRRESEEQTRQLLTEKETILNNALVGIVYLKQRRIVSCNRRLEEIFQYEPGELIGESTERLYDSSEAFDYIGKVAYQTAAEGKSYTTELRLRHKDGSLFWGTLSGRVLDTSHPHEGSIWIYSDITDRKQAAQATQEAKERAELIFQTSPDAVLISRLSDGYITDVNNAFTYHSGHTKEESIGNTTVGLNLWVNPNDRQKFINELQTKGFCENFEAQLWKKDGSQHTGILSARITVIQGVPHIVSTTRDITEYKRVEEALRESEARAQLILDMAMDAVISINQDGMVIGWNREAERMFGYAAGHALGRELAELIVPPAYRKAHKQSMQHFVKTGSSTIIGKRIEITGMRADGSEIPVELAIVAVLRQGEYFFNAFVRDITERKMAEQSLISSANKLRESQRLLEAIVEHIPVMVFLKRASDLRFELFNRAGEELLGYSRSDLLGKGNYDLWPKEQGDWFTAADRKVLASKEVTVIPEEPINTASGETRYLNTWKIALRDEDGEPTHLLGISIDISERKQAEEMLRIAATAFESHESLMITDANRVILRVNKAFTEDTGYTAEEVVGQTPRLLRSGRHKADFYHAMWETIHRTGSWQGEIWDRRKNGEIYPKWLTITAVKGEDGVVTHYVGSHINIKERKAAEEKIQYLGFYDSLTRLANRRLLMDRLHQALASSARIGREGALLLIDLDNFKSLNDTLGHQVGDLLLQQVAQRLESCVRDGDTVARLGGDEFVVMLENLSEQALEAAAQAETIGEKILATLSQPYQLGTHEHYGTASIGATLFDGDPQGSDELLKQADIAMYQAKKAGRNTLRFFDPQMQASISARVELEGELRQALAKQQFHLYYQIQVDSSHRPLGAEALIRWLHPERGLVPPLQFIPLAEETGLILPIGQWVLETACAQLKAWENDALTRDLTLAVNVSAKQFHQADFVTQVQRALLKSSAQPSHLKLELTESIVLENIEDTIGKMHEIKALGVNFSMDDFGTGYSSLQYLKRLPLAQLKIDQSFVRDIATDSSDRAIVRTIIAMAQSLDMDVIAEGVETAEQRQLLLNNGCTHFQGYLFGRPVPIEQFELELKQG